MKKLFSVVLVALFLIGSVSLGYAAGDYGVDNAEIIGARGGRTGVSPYTQLVRVRYGRSGANLSGLSSGDVVSWDTNSNDGVTISAMVIAGNAVTYAGVLVTDIATSDSTSQRGNEKNWGYIAVHGYCLAKVDTSAATSGGALNIANGATGGGLIGAFGTGDLIYDSATISRDIGMLLTDTGTDGLMPVMLR